MSESRFTALINDRLTSFVETNNIIEENQSGFRKGYATIDHVFTLKTIIDIYLSRKKRLYCAFVDFKKAFDTIWRVGLWSKLINLGLSGKILTVIQNKYINAKSCVTCNNNKSDYFMSHNGVRQGENLSPLLFALYVSDIESFFSLRGSSPINVGDDVIDVYMKMFVLLYADDIVIMANDAESLQNNLHYLSEYCDMWNLSVNTDKTKIVIFSKYKYREKHNFIYKNTTIEIVEHFKYLGVIFNFNNSFVKHKKHLFDQANKAMFALLRRNRQLNLPLDIQLELFDSLVLPILTYGCEVWGFENINLIEKLHLKYLKYSLSLKMSTPTCMALGETGRFPVSIHINTRVVSFWSRIIRTSNKNKLSSIMYNIMYAHYRINTVESKWFKHVKNILDNCGVSFIWLSQSITICSLPEFIRLNLREQYSQEWSTTVYNSSKCVLYRVFKKSLIFEKYLTMSPFTRRIICKFRTTNHRLPIEIGRYANLPRHTRLCDKCELGYVGDEFHFLFECPELHDLRTELIPRFCHNNPNMLKLESLMTCVNIFMLNKLAKFISRGCQKLNIYI